MSFADYYVGKRIRIPGQGVGKVTAVNGVWGDTGFNIDPTATVTVNMCSATDVRVLTGTLVTLTPSQFLQCRLVRAVYNSASNLVGYTVDSDEVSLG